jgi:hypothetical protein
MAATARRASIAVLLRRVAMAATVTRDDFGGYRRREQAKAVRKGEAKLRARGIGWRWRCDDEFLRHVEIAGGEAEGATVATNSSSSSRSLNFAKQLDDRL